MSKPTDFQKRVIHAIKNELDYLASSNDIHSPSHYTSISEMFFSLDEYDFGDGPRDKQFDEISEAFRALYSLIAALEPSGR